MLTVPYLLTLLTVELLRIGRSSSTKFALSTSQISGLRAPPHLNRPTTE